MKSSKTWACAKGCDLTLGICPHLEALLPNYGRGSSRSVKTVVADNIDRYSEELVFPTQDEEKFEAVLDKLNLDVWERNLLRDRFLENLTYEELAELNGFSSTGAAYYAIKQIIERIRNAET